MLWRGVDITTFPTPTLWGWVDGLEEEIKTIRAEIDQRAVEAVEGSTDPPTDRTFQRPGGVVPSVRPALTDRGAPPRRDEGEG